MFMRSCFFSHFHIVYKDVYFEGSNRVVTGTGYKSGSPTPILLSQKCALTHICNMMGIFLALIPIPIWGYVVTPKVMWRKVDLVGLEESLKESLTTEMQE